MGDRGPQVSLVVGETLSGAARRRERLDLNGFATAMPSYLEADYQIVRDCLNRKKFAWEEFVDRFMDLVLHVIDYTAERRRQTLSDDERAELCEAIFRSFRYNDYQLLREFAFHSAVSTYLTVITRRLAVAFLSEE